ncbi:hypothetical protein PMZ80_011021 [Knufia obscura]|uniref:DUF1275 domain protein n=1 Tax=Knufia obscura TaxID=1635080 RepID=A0ABR0R977_9EURO|nr:hypothetical protein PMZ80_011021 [Knufia obscura]
MSSELEGGGSSAGSPPRQPRCQRFSQCLNQQVAPDVLLESELMILALAAGINDATTFPDYRVFASNQTGNTALLAVRALGLAEDAIDLQNVGFSLGMFIIGGFCLGQLGHYFGRTRRSWLVVTNGIQTSLVLTAAALRKWVATSKHAPLRYFVISLLALASGGQVAMARTVNVPEITTAMVTSAYIDFFVDPRLLVADNRPRNRRGLFVIGLLVGSFIGAAAYREVEPAFGLLLAGLSKLCICVLVFFNRKETPREVEEETREAVPQRAAGQ